MRDPQGEGTVGMDRHELLELLVAADEEQRRAIADALHDGPVQELASLSIRLGTYRSGLDDPSQQVTIAHFEGTVRRAIDGIRGLILELAPPDVADDLVAGIRDHGAAVLGGDVALEVRGEVAHDLPEPVRRAAFTIVQQALANVRAHASASRVVICLDVADDALTGQVLDDGVGAPPEALLTAAPGHLGLRRMRERAQSLGGWVRVASTPGQGVTVRFRIPLADPTAPAGG